MSPSGTYWRCSIAPVTLMTRSHGARITSDEFFNPLVAHYSSSQGAQYFGWTDAAHTTPSGLARRFIEHYPRIVEAGEGSDWPYAGWYVELLHLTYPNRFPVAYSGSPIDEPKIWTTAIGRADGDVTIPLPPPGEAAD